MLEPFDFKPLCSDYAVHYSSNINYAINDKKERTWINETLPDFISFNDTIQDKLNWTIYTKDLYYENWEFNISTIITIDDANSNPGGKNTTNSEHFWILKMIYVPYFAPNTPPTINLPNT